MRIAPSWSFAAPWFPARTRRPASCAQASEEALARRRTDAVGVQRDDAHVTRIKIEPHARHERLPPRLHRVASRAGRAALRRVHAEVRPAGPTSSMPGCSTRAAPRPARASLRDALHSSRASRSTCCSARPTRASRSPRRPRPRSPDAGATCPTRSTARKRRTTAKAARWSARRCAGRVLIVDDVITAGTAIRESVDIIRAAGATPAGSRCASTVWNAARAALRRAGSPRILRNTGRRDRHARRPARIPRRRAAVRGGSASDRRIPPTIWSLEPCLANAAQAPRLRGRARRAGSRPEALQVHRRQRQGRLYGEDAVGVGR